MILLLLWLVGAVALESPAKTTDTSSVILTAETLSRRDQTSCSNGTYTAPDGLQFEMACGIDYAYKDLNNTATPATDVYDCIGMCSVYPEPCWGVLYNWASGECWFKNENITNTWTSFLDCHSALVPKTLFQNANTSCGYNNGSIATVNDASFNIYCDYDLVGEDYVPQEASGEYDYPYHAGSLQECLEKCSSSHPLCLGVAWNADMQEGWANCYPKKFQTGFSIGTDTSKITHSAVLNLPVLQNSCDNGKNLTVQGGGTYAQQCFQTNAGLNLTTLHTTSFEDCIAACDQNSTCVAVVWDVLMQDGFQNCYLKGNLGVTASTTYTAYAVRVEASNGTTTDSSSSTSTSSSIPWTTSSTTPTNTTTSHNTSLVIGIIVGIVAALALFAGVIWWLYRRKMQSRKTQGIGRGGSKSATPNQRGTLGSHEKQDGDLGTSSILQQSPARSELPDSSLRSELGTVREPRELP